MYYILDIRFNDKFINIFITYEYDTDNHTEKKIVYRWKWREQGYEQGWNFFSKFQWDYQKYFNVVWLFSVISSVIFS